MFTTFSKINYVYILDNNIWKLVTEFFVLFDGILYKNDSIKL